MKYLLIVMAIHFVLELIGKNKDNNGNDNQDVEGNTLHPAEFNIR